jgi:hypothetical protein
LVLVKDDQPSFARSLTTTNAVRLSGLVVSRQSGREKPHFLNPVPVQLIHDRWADKFTERQISALADLKNQLEKIGMTTMEQTIRAAATARRQLARTLRPRACRGGTEPGELGNRGTGR